MIDKVDYLIVGQGLAGTLMAHFLLQAGKEILLIDNGHKNAASKVAAGIINPITGRRFVKSWRINKLIPFAEQTYRELEKRLSIKIFHPTTVIRTLFNRREENDWLLRTRQEGYNKFILAQADPGDWTLITIPAFNYGEVGQAAQVDVKLLVTAYGQYFKDHNRLIQEDFDFNALKIDTDQITYKQWSAGQLIFCEGHRAAHNPYFNYLPYRGAKGEVLIIKIPGANLDKLFKHRLFIVPLGEERYWVGASYNWDYKNDEPTEEGRKFLLDRLHQILKIPFDVEQHLAAIRPTVKDRRPFLGQHPQFPNLFIFNGLGTKGASLGPFWAKHMTDYLVRGEKLDAVININRFV